MSRAGILKKMKALPLTSDRQAFIKVSRKVNTSLITSMLSFSENFS
jgi:hypothetical protein